MTDEKKKKSTEELENMIFSKHFQITIRVVLITVSVMLFFGGGGYLLDRALDTKPLFLIIGLVVAYPVIQMILYRTFRSITKKIVDKNEDN